jgi:uncharacterized protein (DUF2225 family)
MTTLRNEDFSCPACGNTFNDGVVMSMGSSGMDTDFRPHYWGVDPLRFFVHTCPECHYSGYQDDFQEGVRLNPILLQRIKSGMLFKDLEERLGDSLKGNRPFLDGSTKYLLAARTVAASGRGFLKAAELHLRSAWCARVEAKSNVEALAQEEAVRAYRSSMARGEVPAQMQPTVVYLIGELYRRQGEFRDAIEYFSEAEGLASHAGDRDLLSLIRTQRDRAKKGNSGNYAIAARE